MCGCLCKPIKVTSVRLFETCAVIKTNLGILTINSNNRTFALNKSTQIYTRVRLFETCTPNLIQISPSRNGNSAIFVYHSICVHIRMTRSVWPSMDSELVRQCVGSPRELFLAQMTTCEGFPRLGISELWTHRSISVPKTEFLRTGSR